MQIDITSLLAEDQFALSHSQAEGGPSAGRDTWNASLAAAEETALLDSLEKLQAMRDFAQDSGGWDEDEVSAWTPQEVNALFLQWIAGDCRQLPRILPVAITEREPGQWFRDDESDPDSEYGPYDTRSEAYRDYDGTRMHTADTLEEIDWEEAEVSQSEGQAPSNLFRGDGGRVYFTLDS